MKLRIFIADDEPPARARLRSLVEELGHEVCAETGDALSVQKMLDSVWPDVILLDIEMPGSDGLTLARLLVKTGRNIPVILVTAHPEHALAAFDAAAIDYLLKPVRKERLQRALERVSRVRMHETSQAPLLRITIGRKEHLIPITDIDCFLADGGHVLAHSAKVTGFTDMSLQEIEERWHPYVVRVHRSCLAVKAAVTGIERSENQRHALFFRDGLSPVPISRRRLSAVRQLLQDRGSA